jgi:hypothetical protein
VRKWSALILQESSLPSKRNLARNNEDSELVGQ